MAEPVKEGWFSRLKRVKHIEWIAALLVCGIALAVWGTNQTPQTDQVPITPVSQTQTETDAQAKELAQILSSIDGAGRVSVLIAYDSDTLAAGASFGEQKSAKRPSGAIVVAEGASDLGVRMELIRAVRTLLNLPADAVEVFLMQPEPE